MELVKSVIVSHMDFPKVGINFRDITPVFLKPECVETLVARAVAGLK